jgi:hypothetical protein
MILDMMAEARRQELQVRETEIQQRMSWYDSRAVDRLERALGRAKARLRLGGQLAAGERVGPPVSKNMAEGAR